MLQFKRVKVKIDEIKWPEKRLFSQLEPVEKGILKQSIKEIGLLHDIICCRDKDGTIKGVAGYNRWETLKQLGHSEIEVKLFEPCDQRLEYIIQLAENVGRGKPNQYMLLKALTTLVQHQ